MKFVASAISLCILGLGLAQHARGQELDVMVSMAFDPSDQSLYAYASTSLSYGEDYYYETCTQLYMTYYGGTAGSSGAWEGDPACGYGGDSEQDHSLTVPAYADYIEADGYHSEVIDYYDYQFDEGCSDDCYCYWDAYELSTLDFSSSLGEGEGSWSLPGPPGLPSYTQVFNQQTAAAANGACGVPTQEYSEYKGIYKPGDPGWDDTKPFFAGKFEGHLRPTNLDFGGRFVHEAVTFGSENCHAAYPNDSPDTAMPNPGDLVLTANSVWGVFPANGANGSYYGDDSDPTNYLTFTDKIGVRTRVIAFYQTFGVSCNVETASQQMSIEACVSGAPDIPYDTHAIYVDMTPTSATATRAVAQGPAEIN